MSDYGEDDYSDYEEWFYVEDAYTQADELAEHAVGSPPPETYLVDEDEEADRFEYFYDLEYPSDGFDDAEFYTHKVGNAPTGGKRKASPIRTCRKLKKRKTGEGEGTGAGTEEANGAQYSPVLWLSQEEREPKKQELLDADLEPYALRLKGELPCPVPVVSDETAASRKASVAEDLEPTSPLSDAEDTAEGAVAPDASALMAALENNLAAAGGPLSGMDPQQLLQFAMRMMNGEEAGDVAGELADSLLAQGQDDEEEEVECEAPAGLLDWLSKSKNQTTGPSAPATDSATVARSKSSDLQSRPQPLTPPPSVVNHSRKPQKSKTGQEDTHMQDASPKNMDKDKVKPLEEVKNNATTTTTRKRKAAEALATEDAGTSEQAPKKRATRSFDAPTAASRAKSAPKTAAPTTGRTTRSTHSKRS